MNFGGTMMIIQMVTALRGTFMIEEDGIGALGGSGGLAFLGISME